MFGCWVWHRSIILHVFRRKLAALSKKRSLIILIIGMKKRLLSGLLAVGMVFSWFPMSAFAAETQGGGGIDPLTPAAQNTNLDEENGEGGAEVSAPAKKSYTGIDTQEKLIATVNEINKGSGGTYEIVLSKEITLTQSLEITNGAQVTIRPGDTFPQEGNLLKVAENSILTLKNITLQGPLTNSSASLLHVLAGAKVKLENCTLDGNSVDDNGNRISNRTSNGLRLSDATTEVTMENSVIRNCYAANLDGAGARLEDSSTLTVSADSSIQNCVRGTESGGGVYVGSSSVLNLEGTISNCKAGGQGGGVYLSTNSNATLRMAGGTISNCKAGTRGGGVYVYYSSTVEMGGGSKIENCTAKYGGGVYLAGSNAQLVMDNSTISGCTASSGNGGGVYLAGSNAQLIMDNSTISGRTASSGNGSGVYAQGDQASVTMKNGSRIENCTSTSENSSSGGGGVYLYGSNSILTMNGSRIENCTSTSASGSSGGGVYLYGSNSILTMNGSFISGCTASKFGGAAYLAGRFSQMSMDKSSVSRCNAPSGGGIYLSGSNANVSMERSSISECHATTSNGGGVHISGTDAKMDVNNSSIRDCKAAVNGGGVSLCFRAALSLKEGSAITGCNATGNGGGVYLYSPRDMFPDAKLTLEDSSIKNCTAGEGGGVCLDAANALLLAYYGVITGCTANGGSGGGIYFYGANSDLRRPIQAAGAAILTITDCSASVSGGGVFVNSTNGRECNLDFSGCTIYNNKAAVSGSDFYLGKANYQVTLPVVAGKSLTHSTDRKTIDGWYYDPNAEGTRHTLTTPAGRVNTGTAISTLLLNDADCALVACSAMYDIVFEGAYAADCAAYSDRGCTEKITAAAPGDTVYLKYNGSLADDARMSWAAATDGDDAANRDVSVSDSGRVCASFTMPAVNINSCVTITPAVQTVTYYSIQVNAPEGGLEQAVTVVPSAEEGQTVSLVFDPAALPAGKTFGSWVVKKAGENGEIVPVLSSGSTSTSFIMPASDVVVAFTLNDAGQPDTPDKPSEGGGSDDSSGSSSDSGSGADAVIAGAVIGAAGYLAGTHVWLAHLYGFIPENRIQLALALWNRADCPEPESTELYPDIDEDDDDAQAAARWCVEQSLMKDYHKTDKEGHEEITFKPCRYVFRLQAIKAWYELEDLLNEQQAAVGTAPESDVAK